MKHKRLTLITLPVIVLAIVLSGCTSLARMGPKKDIEAYHGDGNIDLLTRHYGPGMETYGYVLDFPGFNAQQNVEKEYKLAGLPLWNRTAQIEILTFRPKKTIRVEEAEKLAPKLSSKHIITCSVINKKTGKIIEQRKAKMSELGESQTLRCMDMPFVKNILSVDLTGIVSSEDLILKMSYDNGGDPTDNEMFIMLIVDAPTA